MFFSLVLATYGRAEDLARLIDSLAAQTDQGFELLVMDQNADQRVLPYVERARERGLNVQHVRMDKPSLSGARNLGIQLAKGDWVAFPDDDCWYESDCIEQVRAAATKHPEWSGLVAHWVEQVAELGPSALGVTGRRDRLYEADWRRFRGGHASSISLFFRRQLLLSVGSFDERLGVGQWFGAGEETDLVLRALSAEITIGRWPAARVHHHFSGATAHLMAWPAALRRARGTGALYVKHRLPVVVFLRGVLAPLARCALPSKHGLGVRGLIALSLGRLQGALFWLLKH